MHYGCYTLACYLHEAVSAIVSRRVPVFQLLCRVQLQLRLMY